MSYLPVFETLADKRIAELEQQRTDLKHSVNALCDAIKDIADCAENLEYEAGWVSGPIAEAVELLDKTPHQNKEGS